MTPTRTEANPVIVVGIDGSEASADALRWAVNQARLSSGELHAVITWQLPSSYGFYVDYTDDDAAADARKTLEKVVNEVAGEPPSVPVNGYKPTQQWSGPSSGHTPMYFRKTTNRRKSQRLP